MIAVMMMVMTGPKLKLEPYLNGFRNQRGIDVLTEAASKLIAEETQ